MNATIIHKANVKSSVLDKLAKELPPIIAEELQVAGGNYAIVRPEQVSLEFTQASPRDVGADLRLMLFARRNDLRSSTGNSRAKSILGKVNELIAEHDDKCSVDIRLYLMEVGAAEHS